MMIADLGAIPKNSICVGCAPCFEFDSRKYSLHFFATDNGEMPTTVSVQELIYLLKVASYLIKLNERRDLKTENLIRVRYSELKEKIISIHRSRNGITGHLDDDSYIKFDYGNYQDSDDVLEQRQVDIVCYPTAGLEKRLEENLSLEELDRLFPVKRKDARVSGELGF